MWKLVQKYGLHTEVQRAKGDDIYELASAKAIRVPYGKLPLDGEDLLALGEAMFHIRALVDDPNLAHPAEGPYVKELDSITFADYCTKIMSAPRVVLQFANDLARGLLGVEADELSMLFIINYLKSGTGLDHMISDLKDGGQSLRCREGMGSIAHGIAEELKAGTIHLSSPVSSIDHSDVDHCMVKTSTSKRFVSKRVIV